jgi:hypothetical protein
LVPTSGWSGYLRLLPSLVPISQSDGRHSLSQQSSFWRFKASLLSSLRPPALIITYSITFLLFFLLLFVCFSEHLTVKGSGERGSDKLKPWP